MSKSEYPTYKELLRHPKWLRKRAAILEKYKSTCQHCRKQTAMLSIHHRYYVAWRKPWQYPDWALIPLCDTPCHRLVQERDRDTFQDWETNDGACDPIPEPSVPDTLPLVLDAPEVSQPLSPEEASARFQAMLDRLGKL